MPVIAFTLKSVTAERKKQVSARLDVNSVPKIKSVEETELELVGTQPTIDIGFEFETQYKPDVGVIKFVGDLIYTDKDIKGVVKKWKKDGVLPENVDRDVKNYLFKKCLTLGIMLSDELQLPAPLVFPYIMPKGTEEQAKYIG